MRPIDSTITYLLLYVDDIIITRSCSTYIDELVSVLHLRFEMTDLGSPKYFLGLEISHSVAGISVCQTKYARDVLLRFGMLASKPCTTPVVLTSATDLSDPCSEEDAIVYRVIVGALHYLTFTRPDIAFYVGKLSQHMHAPCLVI